MFMQKFSRGFSQVKALALVAVLALVSTFSSLALAAPAAVDVSDVVTAIEAAMVPIAAIGIAVLLLLVGIKVYKWIRRAM